MLKGLEKTIAMPIVISSLVLSFCLGQAYQHRQDKFLSSAYACSGILASLGVFSASISYICWRRNRREGQYDPDLRQ